VVKLIQRVEKTNRTSLEYASMTANGGVDASHRQPSGKAQICRWSGLHYYGWVRLVAKEPGANPGRFRHCEGHITASDCDL
jgi:hypothetical protein